jgi:hypothetical protein
VDIEFVTGDQRLDHRAQSCVQKMSEHPERSFPQIFSQPAELEGFYRFLNNPRVHYEDLLSSASYRCLSSLSEEETLFIHDTTLIEPDSKSKTVEDFGSLRGRAHRGFSAHISLAVGLKQKPVIQGLAGAFLWAKSKDQPLGWEGERWWSQIELIENQVPPGKNIHVMDREADSYELFCRLQARPTRFVIRLFRDRCLAGEDDKKLYQEMRSWPSLDEREVLLSKREKDPFFAQSKIYPSRTARRAILCLSAKRIVVQSSKYLKAEKRKDLPKQLLVHVIRVFEKSPLQGSKPVEWCLVTSEPIETLEQIWRVVEVYRRRWVIEEFFKALKTGCRLETRLFSSLESWEKLVSLYLPIACSLYNLKNLVLEPLEFFSPTQWKILNSLAKEYTQPLISLEDARTLIARLGGHIKHSGPPGWIVLARGYQELLTMEVGWNLHRDM